MRIERVGSGLFRFCLRHRNHGGGGGHGWSRRCWRRRASGLRLGLRRVQPVEALAQRIRHHAAPPNVARVDLPRGAGTAAPQARTRVPRGSAGARARRVPGGVVAVLLLPEPPPAASVLLDVQHARKRGPAPWPPGWARALHPARLVASRDAALPPHRSSATRGRLRRGGAQRVRLGRVVDDVEEEALHPWLHALPVAGHPAPLKAPQRTAQLGTRGDRRRRHAFICHPPSPLWP